MLIKFYEKLSGEQASDVINYVSRVICEMVIVYLIDLITVNEVRHK